MAKNKKVNWIDEKRLKDPMFWFMKASFYSSAVLYLLEKYNEQFNEEKIEASHLLNAISATPYLTGLAAELYMKGYLVFKGMDSRDLKKERHNLETLREMCLGFGDQRFKDDDLIFLTDTLGAHIMESGGIRYPDKKEMAIYNSIFEKTLRLLKRIVREIEKELTAEPKILPGIKYKA